MTAEHSANAVSRAKYQTKIYATMEISGRPVKMQVDSGASCNVMPRKLLPKDTIITKTDLKLTSYSKTNLEVLGLAKISLRNPKNKKKYRAEFAVVGEDNTPLLGSAAAQQMNLITVQHENILQLDDNVVPKDNYQGLTMENITETYRDVFKGLGCMEGKLHLEVDETIPPTVMPPRRVPLAVKDRLK